MFQASFEPNANFYTDMGQEIVQADSLQDTWTQCFLWRKSLELQFICLANNVIVVEVRCGKVMG